jgi:ribosomal protein S18 acetylase RimI-like enzyme
MSAPGEGLQLHVVGPDQWREWRGVRLQALAEAPYAFSSTLAEWAEAPEERWRERLSWRSSHNLLAYDEQRPVGMATGVLREGQPDTADLFSMWVAPAARGGGVAEALINAVEGWARDVGARTLCLDVRAENPRARRTYERLGFEVTGEVERSSATEPLELTMAKPLGPG